MHVKRSEDVPSVATPNGEVVYELIGAAIGVSDNHSVAKIAIPPGKGALRHYHPIAEESYYIISGSAIVEIDEERQQLRAGDTVLIPANAVHTIRNQSSEMLVFLAICVPAWTTDCSVFVE